MAFGSTSKAKTFFFSFDAHLFSPGVEKVDPGLTLLDGEQFVIVGVSAGLELLNLLNLRE